MTAQTIQSLIDAGAITVAPSTIGNEQVITSVDHTKVLETLKGLSAPAKPAGAADNAAAASAHSAADTAAAKAWIEANPNDPRVPAIRNDYGL